MRDCAWALKHAIVWFILVCFDIYHPHIHVYIRLWQIFCCQDSQIRRLVSKLPSDITVFWWIYQCLSMEHQIALHLIRFLYITNIFNILFPPPSLISTLPNKTKFLGLTCHVTLLSFTLYFLFMNLTVVQQTAPGTAGLLQMPCFLYLNLIWQEWIFQTVGGKQLQLRRDWEGETGGWGRVGDNLLLKHAMRA